MMTPAGLAMLLLIVFALVCLDIVLWVRVRRQRRAHGSQDDFR